VNHVEGKQHRNLEPRLLHRDTLKFICFFDPSNVEGRTEQPLANKFEVLRPRVAVCFTIQHLKLAEFLFKRHSGKQGVYLLFEVRLERERGRYT
jgi:hypothetical protein